MVKLPFNLIILPLIKPQEANQQQLQKNEWLVFFQMTKIVYKFWKEFKKSKYSEY